MVLWVAVTLSSTPGFNEYNAYIPMITFFFPGGEDNPRVPHARMDGQEGRGGKFLSQASFLLFKKKDILAISHQFIPCVIFLKS